mmetsp:Transcript_4226/g.6742  ORF Transcript_4226/g.6742 Transcript_4226/m.6742 type:complete len:235 (-) Transcript_4226:251-955(-)
MGRLNPCMAISLLAYGSECIYVCMYLCINVCMQVCICVFGRIETITQNVATIADLDNSLFFAELFGQHLSFLLSGESQNTAYVHHWCCSIDSFPVATSMSMTADLALCWLLIRMLILMLSRTTSSATQFNTTISRYYWGRSGSIGLQSLLLLLLLLMYECLHAQTAQHYPYILASVCLHHYEIALIRQAHTTTTTSTIITGSSIGTWSRRRGVAKMTITTTFRIVVHSRRHDRV